MPVNPFCAIKTDMTATMAPQPMLSLTILGLAIPFIMGEMGAWYSAVPSAFLKVVESNPIIFPAAAAPASAPQLPEEW